MPTNSYDLIVIGGDFAGLVAGALCAKRGMRVLMLAHGSGPYGYQVGSHKLPVEPLALCGLGTPAVRRVIAELNLGHTLKRKLVESPASFQFVAPDIRLDASADEEKLIIELSRELAAADLALAACAESAELSSRMDAVFADISGFPPTGFWKKRELGKNAGRVVEDADEWLARTDSDPLLRAFASLPARLGTHAAGDELASAAVARAFHLWRQGTPRLRGDWAALREMLLDKLQQGSGESRDARVAELTFSWGKVNGVRLENGEELGANHVIAALPVGELVDLLERKAPKRLVQCADAMSVAGYRYTLNLVVNQAGIPEGMSSPVLVTADPSRPLAGDNALAVFLEPPDDQARVVVSVAAVCPVPEEDRSLDDAFADLHVRVREQLEMVMPFFSEHVLIAHAPYESAPPEGLPVELGHEWPLRPSPVWSSTLDAALGVSAVPYSVGLKHLTMASDQMLPRLGVEGSFIAGWCAARIACDAAGKKRDYLKDEVIAP